MTEKTPWIEVHRVEEITPMAPGWHAVFVANCFDEGPGPNGEKEWRELETRPLLALARVKVVKSQAHWRDPDEQQWADADTEIRGVVMDDAIGQWMTVTQRGDFLGYQAPGQPLELFLEYLDTELPLVIPTPEQKREQECQWAAERRSAHNVIDPPWLTT